jgi:hypothetical protein
MPAPNTSDVFARLKEETMDNPIIFWGFVVFFLLLVLPGLLSRDLRDRRERRD